MPDPNDPRFAAWPAMLARLDPEVYDALAATLDALTAGHLLADELNQVVTEVNTAAIAVDLLQMQGPEAIAAHRHRQSRDELVGKIDDLAHAIAADAGDLSMMLRQLTELDARPAD